LRQFEKEVKFTDSLFIFEGLSPKEIKEINGLFASPQKFNKGEVIYGVENFQKSLGYIIDGKATAVCDNSSGLYMNSFEKGSCFGAAALFDTGNKYVSTIVADTDTTVLFITEEQLKSIFVTYPQTAINYINFLSEKVRFLNRKLGLISCGSSDDTVFKYLSSVADKDGLAKLPQSMTLVSKTLGIGRATLYRCLDNLENKGLIVRENNIIKVIKNEKNS
jgi:CRP-like cAMP-binding protein